jgi:DNA polymerase-3 subunit epsilon
MSHRQIVLDTETTGIDPKQGHCIIEIGCVELINRELTGRHYHQYINPQREIEAEAFAVHGISNEMLADKPVFRDIAEAFVEFVSGAELVIHNAPFDIGHINAYLERLGSTSKLQHADITKVCTVLDTLLMARQKHPGQRNNLDALCKRYAIDNSQRDLHGALLDAEILAEVYLAMTGGQMELGFGSDTKSADGSGTVASSPIQRTDRTFRVINATQTELDAHETMLNTLESKSGQRLWIN